jgi:hypothetical protein
MTTKPVHVRANIPNSADLNMAFGQIICEIEARTPHGRFWAYENCGRVDQPSGPGKPVFLKLHRERYCAAEIGDVVIEDALIRLARCQRADGAHREIFIHAIVCG